MNLKRGVVRRPRARAALSTRRSTSAHAAAARARLAARRRAARRVGRVARRARGAAQDRRGVGEGQARLERVVVPARRARAAAA